MKTTSVLFSLLAFLLSCHSDTKQGKGKSKAENMDIRDFNGTAYIFTEQEPITGRLYVIPLYNKDSYHYSTNNHNDVRGNTCLQINIGDVTIFDKYSALRKRIIKDKLCNLPYDSMFYSVVALEYRNYNEIPMQRQNYSNLNIINFKDSCKTKLIVRTDSSYFKIHKIY